MMDNGVARFRVIGALAFGFEHGLPIKPGGMKK
jgi:hypothetical protein